MVYYFILKDVSDELVKCYAHKCDVLVLSPANKRGEIYTTVTNKYTKKQFMTTKHRTYILFHTLSDVYGP